MTEEHRGEKLVHLASSLTNSRRSVIKRMAASHSTPDMIRLNAKLKDPEVERLYNEGLELVTEEGLDEALFQTVNLSEVYKDLAKEVFGLTYEDIKLAVEDVDESLLEDYSFVRLDWTWDFMWSFHLWPRSKFSTNSLRLYGLVRGPSPRSLHDNPLQLVLNVERKRRIRRWERRVARAAINGDFDEVRTLNAQPEAISRAKAAKLVSAD